jgi:triacylglycerol lipase
MRTRTHQMPFAYEGAVVHPTLSWRARLLQRAARFGLKPLMTHGPLNGLTIRATRTVDRLSAAAPRSRFIEQVRFELGGVRVEEMVHRDGPTSAMSVLYLHGGAFISGGIETHRRICERLALRTGAPVISVDYVQLPEGNVADSVQDAISAYEGLVKEARHPDKIVVAGDSGGGYLTMKIAELADRRGLPRPAALLLFSPMLSLDFDRPGKVSAVIEASDAYIPVRRVADIRARWLPDDATIEGHTSPLNATSRISSPTCIVVADNEVLRPEAEALAHRLSERGVDVEFHLFRRQLHAFPVLTDAMPESRTAIDLAAAFARHAVGEGPDVGS